MAKIGLEDVRFYGPHGYYEEEKLMGTEFSIDLEVEAEVGMAAEHDDLAGTVSYATIYHLLQAEMKKPTLLLEALAHRMAVRVMQQFEGVSSVRLKLKKLAPPIGGRVGAAYVEISLNNALPGRGQQTFEDDEEPFPDDFKGDGGFDAGGFRF